MRTSLSKCPCFHCSHLMTAEACCNECVKTDEWKMYEPEATLRLPVEPKEVESWN